MVNIKKRTVKAPKWFVELKGEFEKEFDRILQKHDLSLEWWEQASDEAREGFVNELNRGERSEFNKIYSLTSHSGNYAFAKYIWKKWGQSVDSPDKLSYNRMKKTITMSWGLIESLKEAWAGLGEQAREILEGQDE